MKIGLVKKLKNRLNSGYNAYLAVYSRVPSYVLFTVSWPDQNKSSFNYNRCSVYSCNCTGLQLRLALRWDHNLRYLHVSVCSSWLITTFPLSTGTWQAFWHSMHNCNCFLIVCITSSTYHQIRQAFCIYRIIIQPSPHLVYICWIENKSFYDKFPRSPFFLFIFTLFEIGKTQDDRTKLCQHAPLPVGDDSVCVKEIWRNSH